VVVEIDESRRILGPDGAEMETRAVLESDLTLQLTRIRWFPHGAVF